MWQTTEVLPDTTEIGNLPDLLSGELELDGGVFLMAGGVPKLLFLQVVFGGVPIVNCTTKI